MRFSWFLLSILFGVAGCGTTEVVVDGGPGADGAPAAGTLTLLSEPNAALLTGETTTIAVRYTEGGAPVAGAEVRFALIGTAHDSAVADLSLQTGADGRASTAITAGTIAAAFRVRATGGGAPPVFVNVAVSTEGFGTLRAVTRYEGRRAENAAQVLRVYANTDCDPEDGYPTFADRSLTIEAGDEIEARWSLPVGLTYAVVGVLRMDGVVLASGCVDEVTLTADAETETTVTLADESLRPDGRYDAQVELRPGAAGTTVVEHALAGGRDALEDGDASLYLDALEEELRERDEEAAADALVAARVTQEEALALALAGAAVGPSEALNRLEARLAARLSVLALSGPLSLSADAMVLGGVWALEGVSVGPADPDAPPVVSVDVEGLAPTAPRLELSWRPEADVIDLDSLSLTLRLGALLGAVLDAELDAAVAPGVLVEDGAGCSELAAWIAAEATTTDACDAECADAACARALGPLMLAVRDQLRGEEALRDRLELNGSLAATDDDADIVVDRIEGRGLTGTWSGASDEDPVTADLVGTRAVE